MNNISREWEARPPKAVPKFIPGTVVRETKIGEPWESYSISCWN